MSCKTFCACNRLAPPFDYFFVCSYADPCLDAVRFRTIVRGGNLLRIGSLLARPVAALRSASSVHLTTALDPPMLRIEHPCGRARGDGCMARIEGNLGAVQHCGVVCAVRAGADAACCAGCDVVVAGDALDRGLEGARRDVAGCWS